MKSKALLAIVVPCYNEEEVLPETINRLSIFVTKLKNDECIADASFVLFVDDGSRDRTWDLIMQTNQRESQFRGLKLSKNFGHQNALVAGMDFVRDHCDCIVTLDADLQDDIEVIREGLGSYYAGANIVYFVRRERSKDTWFKRSTAHFFYVLMHYLGVNVVYNHADYRLIDQNVLNSFFSFREVNLFLRGMFPLLGFSSATVLYDREERFAGESKYPLKKMLAFALDGITSFSVVPLRLVSFTGFFIFVASLFMGLYVLFHALVTGMVVPGWASTTLPIYFLGGVQLLSLGVIGEYIGKIYVETKARPKYFIQTRTE